MMAASPPSTALLRQNLIINCFNTLKKCDHFVKEGSSQTNYEAFWDKLNHGFSLSLRPYKPSNSAVEAFYRSTMPIDQFLFDVEENIIKKAQDKLDANLDPLLTISWDVFCSYTFHKELCEKVTRLCGRQIWAIFNKLDVDSSGFVAINDITELILKIFYSNGKSEDAKNIHEWFCEQSRVDFWSFFSALVQNHIHLLQLHVIQEIYDEVVHEILKQGKMVKKGHKVQTWKERWFVLTSTNLYYYESLENRIQKGAVTINHNTKANTIPATKARNYLFQVTDGLTNRAYDISAPDPQVQKDWVEVIQVVVAAQSTQGRNLLHRLSLARESLFPSNHSRLPSYTPSSSSADYNEGVYRVVRPTSPLAREPTTISETSSGRHAADTIPLNGGLSSSSSTPIHQSGEQKKQGPPVAPYHKTSGSKVNASAIGHDYDLLDEVIEGSQSDAIVSPPVQKPAPYHKTSSGSKIDHVNVDGHDYALVDKLLEEDQSDPPPPPVPKPAPYHKTSTSKIEHVSVGGHDYALVDKLLEGDQNDSASNPLPPAPKPRGPPPEVKPYSPAAQPLPPHLPRPRTSESESQPPPPLPKPRDGRRKSEGELQPPLPARDRPLVLPPLPAAANDTQPPPPVPKSIKPTTQPPPRGSKESGRPFSPISGSQNPPTMPKTRGEGESKVGQTAYISSETGSYAQLTFANSEPPANDSIVPRQHSSQPAATQSTKIPSSVARTKFDYSDVIVAPLATKDIDKALELKASKPAVPAPPPKYDPHAAVTKRKSLSDFSISIGSSESSSPTKPAHTYQNIHYTPGGTRNEVQEKHEEAQGEAPPPPPPRRLESCRTDSPDPTSSLSPTGPTPAPRSPRRPIQAGAVPSPFLPPLPPR